MKIPFGNSLRTGLFPLGALPGLPRFAKAETYGPPPSFMSQLPNMRMQPRVSKRSNRDNWLFPYAYEPTLMTVPPRSLPPVSSAAQQVGLFRSTWVIPAREPWNLMAPNDGRYSTGSVPEISQPAGSRQAVVPRFSWVWDVPAYAVAPTVKSLSQGDNIG